MSYATYHALCWANNKTKEEIQEEINRLDGMWTSRIEHPFPGNATIAYVRMMTLKSMLEHTVTA